MRKRRWTLKRVLLALLLVGAIAAPLYLLLIRPWQLRWGATDAEVERSLPGDDFVDRPTFNATRAVTVNAPPEKIWPWLLQMGLGRAGWYSYDWIDNLSRPSARRILPKLQGLKPGDIIPVSPDGKQGFKVHTIEPNRYMIWGAPGEMSWLWYLDPVAPGKTRLLTRIRIRYDWTQPSIAFFLLTDVGDIVMMRKCLLGIKERAESLGSGQPPET
jgi:hypothetical protein